MPAEPAEIEESSIFFQKRKDLDDHLLDPQGLLTIEFSSISRKVSYLSPSTHQPSKTTPQFDRMASSNTTSLGERMAQLSLASDNGVGDLLPSAGAPLKVLSYLNAEKIQEEIISVEMRAIMVVFQNVFT